MQGRNQIASRGFKPSERNSLNSDCLDIFGNVETFWLLFVMRESQAYGMSRTLPPPHLAEESIAVTFVFCIVTCEFG